ncbi:MAG: Re/Si-specific NAD(P)(+) transhydrogenase subunit alpha [Betaproteobacteria bacterium]|jgi:NAD(P) transhydrogenase subunit alpha|nr:Re/Si-specific NAD(P)(+) transhydrogenase subunit alpha [Betaproteobacteria bacterium]NBO81688.1 Re/Si-specific NAD(P)(+) transhydrogenase subunit alpha [Betaproteobacteria bacterium]
MHLGIPKESSPGETRVAATPETVKKLVTQGHQVTVARGAGLTANFTDDAFSAAGAVMAEQSQALGAEVVLKVRIPSAEELGQMKRNAILIGMLNPFDRTGLDRLAAAGLTAFAMEAAPRTTRAQSLDVLSSQANLAGYKAVMLAADAYPRIFPMLMTAAGTVKAARVVILGAGVAGLQAIATAKRLGAVVEASDVRPAVKEQIESLGAKFIDVPFETDEEREIAKGVGGYARPMPEAWMKRQAAEVAKRIALADIVISTALIPGRKAPTLITEEMVKSMKPGSVIVDMAVEQGGNCPLSELGKTVVKHGVILVGQPNIAALVPTDASALYARNLMDFLKLLITKEGSLSIPADDDIVTACLMTKDGAVLRAQ